MSTIQSHVQGEMAFEAIGAHVIFDEKSLSEFIDAEFGRPIARIEPSFEEPMPLIVQSSPAGDDSAQMEFLKRRDLLARAAGENPAARLAAFLVAVLNLNSDEGWGALVVSETTDARFVADFLGLSLDELKQHLLQFQSQGLVAPLPNGSLQINDLDGLERMAEGETLIVDGQASEDHYESPRAQAAPRIYTRGAAETLTLRDYDSAIRFDVFTVSSVACLVVAFAIALGIVGF
jgi:hypothetical protein